MTDILADLAGMQKYRGQECVRVRIQREHPDLVQAFDEALASHYSGRSIAEWFAARGVETTGQAISNHRNKVCVRCRAQTS